MLRRAQADLAPGMTLSQWLRDAIEVKLDSAMRRPLATPMPEMGFFYARCPRCGKKIWNGLFTTHLGYLLHWQDHLIDDLEEGAGDG